MSQKRYSYINPWHNHWHSVQPVLIVVMVASVLWQFLWERLPVSIGIARLSGLDYRYADTHEDHGRVSNRCSHGHAGPDPACEPLIGMLVPTSAIPGLLAALILGLPRWRRSGSGTPYHDREYRTGRSGAGSRMFPRIAKLDWTIPPLPAPSAHYLVPPLPPR